MTFQFRVVVAGLAEELGRAEVMRVGGEDIDAIEATADGAIRVLVVPQHAVVDTSDGTAAQAKARAVSRTRASRCRIADGLNVEHAGAR